MKRQEELRRLEEAHQMEIARRLEMRLEPAFILSELFYCCLFSDSGSGLHLYSDFTLVAK